MKKLLICMGFVLVLFAGVGLVFGSTVADVAKKEKERRAKIKNPPKVLTNQDIAEFKARNKDQSPTTVEGEAEETATEPETAKEEKPKDPDLANDEQYWRGRYQENSKKVEDLQSRLDQMQSDFNALMRNTGVSDTQLSGEIGVQRDEIEKMKQQLDQAKSSLEGLEEEARKAGAPPGWVRE